MYSKTKKIEQKVATAFFFNHFYKLQKPFIVIIIVHIFWIDFLSLNNWCNVNSEPLKIWSTSQIHIQSVHWSKFYISET